MRQYLAVFTLLGAVLVVIPGLYVAGRLLAYSTVSQVGYLLMAVAVAQRTDLNQPSLLFYLAAYTVTNLGPLGGLGLALGRGVPFGG